MKKFYKTMAFFLVVILLVSTPLQVYAIEQTEGVKQIEEQNEQENKAENKMNYDKETYDSTNEYTYYYGGEANQNYVFEQLGNLVEINFEIKAGNGRKNVSQTEDTNGSEKQTTDKTKDLVDNTKETDATVDNTDTPDETTKETVDASTQTTQKEESAVDSTNQNTDSSIMIEENAKAIRLITASDNVDYTIQIDEKDSNKEDGQDIPLLKEPLTGKLESKGGSVIALPDDLLLEKNKDYVIKVTLQSEQEITLACFEMGDTSKLNYLSYRNEDSKDKKKEDTTNEPIEHEIKDYGVRLYTNDRIQTKDKEEDPTKQDEQSKDEQSKEEMQVPNQEAQAQNQEIKDLKEEVKIPDQETQTANTNAGDLANTNNTMEPTMDTKSIENLPSNQIKREDVPDWMMTELLDKNAEDTDENPINMVAHRGMSSLAPENTVAAMKMAGLYGYGGVEFDVRETKDGKFVVMHDPDVIRTTNGNGKVSKMTLAQIKKLTIDSGNGIENYSNLKVPTVEEILECCQQYNLTPNLEIKNSKNLKALLKIIKKYDFTDTIKISSSNTTYLSKLRKMNKNLMLYYISNSDGKKSIDTAVKLKIKGVNLVYRYMNKDVVDYAKKKKKELTVWDVNDVTNDYQARNCGVQGIITNGVTDSNKLDYLEKRQEYAINQEYNAISTNPSILKKADTIKECLEKKNTYYEADGVNTVNVDANTGYQYELLNEDINMGTVIIVTAKVNAIAGNQPYFTVNNENRVIGKVGDLIDQAGWMDVQLVYTAQESLHSQVLFGINSKESGVFRIKDIQIREYNRYNPDEISILPSLELKQGDSYLLQDSVEPNSNSLLVTWSSSKEKVASISLLGQVKAKKPGKSMITVSAENGKKAQCTVIVKPNKMSKPKTEEKTKNTVKLSWKKLKSVSGYEIYEKKAGEDYQLVKTISKASTASTTLKKRKAGTKYNYKIRAYIKIDGEKYYGDFSKALSVKTQS